MQIQQEKIEKIIQKYPREKRFALAAMQDMQQEFTYVPREGLSFLAEYLSCHFSELFAMATFYKALFLEPRGRHIIKLCDGTACHIGGSQHALDCVNRRLGIVPGQTSPDGLFSLEKVNCVGACAFAPVITIDDKPYAKMNDEKISAVLASYRESG